MSVISLAQVGVGTNDPKASLHVEGSPTDAAKVDGVIIPKLTGNQLHAKNAAYGADQIGAMVYVTALPTTPGDDTVNINKVGFYYHDGTVWQPVGGASDNFKIDITGVTMVINGTQPEIVVDLTDDTTTKVLKIESDVNFFNPNTLTLPAPANNQGRFLIVITETSVGNVNLINASGGVRQIASGRSTMLFCDGVAWYMVVNS
jgi:hypothetical protein